MYMLGLPAYLTAVSTMHHHDPPFGTQFGDLVAVVQLWFSMCTVSEKASHDLDEVWRKLQMDLSDDLCCSWSVWGRDEKDASKSCLIVGKVSFMLVFYPLM
jgi:hypothetical protein